MRLRKLSGATEMQHIHQAHIKCLLLIYYGWLVLINMTIYSLEALVGTWHANFLIVAHLHRKKERGGKPFEAF